MPRPVLQGDESELFAAHHEPVVRTVANALRIPRAVAEDAASIAWIQFLRKQPRRDQVAAWLRVVTLREAIRLWDLELRTLPLDGSTQAKAVAADPHEMRAAIAALPAEDRVLLTRVAAGYSHGEIADKAGLTKRAVMRRVKRARGALRAAA